MVGKIQAPSPLTKGSGLDFLERFVDFEPSSSDQVAVQPWELCGNKEHIHFYEGGPFVTFNTHCEPVFGHGPKDELLTTGCLQ